MGFDIRNYIFEYAYPVAFVGSMFYGICSIINLDPSTVVANKNVSVVINGYIGVCGVIALFNWYQNTPVPVIGTYLVPNQNLIKSQA
jgi:hypothetical protein